MEVPGGKEEGEEVGDSVYSSRRRLPVSFQCPWRVLRLAYSSARLMPPV